MIRLGELLKVLDLDGPTLDVVVQVSLCEYRHIRDSRIGNYLDREVTNICFDTANVDYYEDYYAEFYVEVTIAGTLLEEDKI